MLGCVFIIKKEYTIDYIVENEIDINNHGFIYITTNNINDKKYIGQRKFNNCRWKEYLGSGKLIKKSIAKYCKENFSRKIIDIGKTQEDLNRLEEYYINKYDAVNSLAFYNIASGGKSGNKFAGKTEKEMAEIGLKISKSNSGIYNPNYGKSFTEEHRKRISESNIGKKLTDITKNKLSILNSGKNNNNYGKLSSEETKRKMSENHADFSGKNNPSSRSVICITTKIVFNTCKDGGIFYNVNFGSISSCCRKKLKSAGKHPETGEKLVWMYYEDWLDLNSKKGMTK